jgi:hypothetical protein
MQVSEIFTLRPRLEHAHARIIVEQKMSVGDHDLAVGEAFTRFVKPATRHFDLGDYFTRAM